MKIRIEHSDSNPREYGYGLYINGVTMFRPAYEGHRPIQEVLASECLPFSATPEQIRRAERRVRARALRKFHGLEWEE